MALTDNGEVFGALHEEGINLLIRHVMTQRPSLFNYGTQHIADNPTLLCQEVDTVETVSLRSNPILKVVDPLPVLPIGDQLALNYCLQVTDLEIDFHPGSVFDLPDQLGELGEQSFSLRGRACGGLDCPSDEFVDSFEPSDDDDPDREPVVPEVNELICFCLELFMTGRFEAVSNDDTLATMLKPKIDEVEIADIGPEGLENSIECYIGLVARLVLLPELSKAIAEIVPGFLETLNEDYKLTLLPAPLSATLSHNPAVEEDQIKLSINVEEVTP